MRAFYLVAIAASGHFIERPMHIAFVTIGMALTPPRATSQAFFIFKFLDCSSDIFVFCFCANEGRALSIVYTL